HFPAGKEARTYNANNADSYADSARPLRATLFAGDSPGSSPWLSDRLQISPPTGQTRPKSCRTRRVERLVLASLLCQEKSLPCRSRAQYGRCLSPPFRRLRSRRSLGESACPASTCPLSSS